jgi:hypothetical protein
MTPWPLDWKNFARLAALACDCCGRGEQRHVPIAFEIGQDTGLPCASPECQFCTGQCRATFVIVDYERPLPS